MCISGTEPVRKCVDVEKLREWRARLHEIVEPITRYQQDQDAMKNAVIKQSAVLAKMIIEDIEREMGPRL